MNSAYISVPQLTLGEYLRFLLPRPLEQAPIWPPDVFAVCASLLLKSGAYTSILKNWPPTKYRDSAAWAIAATRIGGEWRKSWVNRKAVPAEVDKLWKTLTAPKNAGRLLSKFGGYIGLRQTAIELFAIADEACQSVGSPLGEQEEWVDQNFLAHAADLLDRDLPGSSLCEEIDAGRVRVLPKMHTAQAGLTVRSFSLYLALCSPSEVIPRWVNSLTSFPAKSLNLLLVPWPLEVLPIQFRESRALRNETRNMPDRFGLFTFHGSQSLVRVVPFVKSLYEASVAHLGRIDGIILPEVALTPLEHQKLRKYAQSKGAFLVSGVGAAPDGQTPGRNEVRLDLPFHDSLSQHKHHRWKLDSSQIKQYGLGSILYPERDWWEHIGIDDRSFLFASLTADIVLSALVCEDLARPDPVGDLVRAVGPNLVIALLMDGPQIKERWSGRYAIVLADDPGCSVLTLTSAGMSKLSRPRDGKSRSRVIGLWKDAKDGIPQEIEMDDGSEAVVLSISMRYLEEWTADGRTDEGNAVYPVLSGVHCITGYNKK